MTAVSCSSSRGKVGYQVLTAISTSPTRAAQNFLDPDNCLNLFIVCFPYPEHPLLSLAVQGQGASGVPRSHRREGFHCERLPGCVLLAGAHRCGLEVQFKAEHGAKEGEDGGSGGADGALQVEGFIFLDPAVVRQGDGHLVDGDGLAFGGGVVVGVEGDGEGFTGYSGTQGHLVQGDGGKVGRRRRCRSGSGG